MLGGTPGPLRPDAASELSDGVVVQTQLLGRVLGVRLLRVDGTVLVTPARLASGPLAATRATAPSAGPTAVTAPGSELAEAARLLRENDEVLGRRR